jgi:hypothetical protein
MFQIVSFRIQQASRMTNGGSFSSPSGPSAHSSHACQNGVGIGEVEAEVAARVDIKYAPNYKACFHSAFKLYSGMTLSSCYSSATCNAVEALEAHLYACSASEGDSTHSQNRQQHPERNRPVEYRASPNLPPTACPSNDKAHHPLQTDRIGADQRRKREPGRSGSVPPPQ